MKLTGGQIVCESLLREGVEVIFGLPGGAILPLYQTLPQYPKLRHILVRHEQGGSMAADGYARATGKVGVVWATSGPGATNLATGLATAYGDSVPIVAITGQVGRAAIGTDAFQETDTTGVTLPITKHNYLVMSAAEIARTIKEAFYIASTGRPGPVLVDIPKDVFNEVAQFEYPKTVDLPAYHPVMDGDENQVRLAAEMINESEKPVILAGHGIIISGAYKELRELAEKAQIPVVTTLLGLSSFPENHVLSVGMPGMHGAAYASLAVDEADLLIALGMRFDDRVVGRVKDFAKHSRKIHVDIDPAEINKSVRVDVPIVGDLKRVIAQINKEVKPGNHMNWLQRVDQLKKDHPSFRVRDTKKLLPQFVLKKLWEITQGKSLIVTGVGQHQMWAALHYTFTEPNSLITSGSAGSMGFEVPGAMGAKVGCPDKTVWSICGDGGFQMTMYELATMVENKIAAKFAIMNNNNLGMVRQWQQFFYEKNYVATLYSRNPDFVKLAEAFGALGIRVTDKAQVAQAIERAMQYDGPAVIDFQIEWEENVYPMIPAGTSVKELMEEPHEEKVTWNR